MVDATPTRRLVALIVLGALSLVALWFVARPLDGPGPESVERSVARVDTVERTEGLGDVAIERGPQETTAVAAGPAERVALEAAPDAELAGGREVAARVRIVDRANGEPVEGAFVDRVWVDRGKLKAGWTGAPSDADGVLEVRWSGAPAIDVRLEATGFVSGLLAGLAPTDPEAPDTDLLEVGLQRSTTVTVLPVGFASDAEGVALLYEGGDARDRKPDHRLVLDGVSPLVFEGVRPGRVGVVLCARGQPVVAKQQIEAPPGEDVRVELVAKRGETLRGRVVEKATRQPLADVKIVAAPALSGVAPQIERLPFPPVETGADGSFSIVGVPPGEIVLTLHPPFGPPVERELVVIEGEATRTRDLAVPGAATVSGRVVVPSELKEQSVGVAVVATSEVSRVRGKADGTALLGLGVQRGRAAVATVGADGSFTCPSAPSGRSISVVAWVGGHLGVTTISEPLAFGEERRGVEVVVEAVEPLRFRVVDDDGAPVEAVRAAFRWALGPSSRWSGNIDLDGPGGRFEVPVGVRGVRKVRLRADGFLPFDAPWPATEGVPEGEPEFVLRRELTAEVLVRETSGLAIRGARVTATLTGGGEERPARASDRADGFGRATLALPEEGTWSVRVGAADYHPSEPVEIRVSDGAPAAELVVTLEPLEPPEPATVEGMFVRKGDGAPLPALRFDGLRGGSAEIDGARFRLVGIRPGRVTLVAHAVGYESVKLPIDQLAPGERRDVGELTTRGACRVEVRVKDRKGRPVRDARVRLVRLPTKKGGREGVPPKVDFPKRSDGRGKYVRSGVARANWRLVVDRKGNKRHSRTVKISGSKTALDVVLEPR